MVESKEKWFLGHTHLKMSWIHYQMKQKDGFITYPPPIPYSPSYQSSFGVFHQESKPSTPSTPSSGSKISPAVLFVIVILAVLFFISGILHLLVRFLIKHPLSSSSQSNNRYPEISSSDALQRQLQQLFHLHDSGLDQAFIDSLPVFQYKEIVGLKEPFDCPVCLCEFTEKDKLRLLPTCSHAFHISCIDTWLLSNSTCPLCRDALFNPDLSMENPMVEFGGGIREDDGCLSNTENGYSSGVKTMEIEEIVGEKGILPVRLGKFKRLDNGPGEEPGGETSSSNLDARRCFSMGSYQYVLGQSDLKVPLYHDQLDRELKFVEGVDEKNISSYDGEAEGKKISSVTKGESYSVSKIWQWSKKGKFSSSSDSHGGFPSSLNADLPWMNNEQDI